MHHIKAKCNFELWYLLYADDLVFICDHNQVEHLLNTLFEVSQKFKLIVNPKKCGIINIKKHQKLSTTANLHGIPIIE